MAECKLTPEIEKIIIKNLKKGATFETAAQAIGICRRTLHNWIEEGEKGNPDFTHFAQSIKEARAEVELDLVEVVYDASKKEPDHAKWLLSHMNNEAWGQKSEQKIEHTITQPIKFVLFEEPKKDEDAKPTVKPAGAPGDKDDKDIPTAKKQPETDTS
jgi:DNA-binding XRE family transcriptional regulator